MNVLTTPTIAEEQLLKEFRRRVSDILKTGEQREDLFLIRWLRARDMNLVKAEQMLRSSFNWREENNVDKILDTQIDPLFVKEFPYKIKGIDIFSHPVLFIPIGKWDIRKIASLGRTEEFKVYINYIFQDICREIRQRNSNSKNRFFAVTQFTVIFDMSGYSMKQLMNIKALQNLLYATKTYETHYPEVLFRCFFINCASFCNILLTMLKPFLAQRTYEKLSIYGSHQKEWEKALREIIDCDQLASILRNSNVRPLLCS